MPWQNTGPNEPAPQPVLRPHMHPRAEETRQQRCDRLAHSCYRCGTQYRDHAALNLHEDHCTG